MMAKKTLKCDWCDSTESITVINDKKACIEHLDEAMGSVFAPIKAALVQRETPLRCAICGLRPHELDEYVSAAIANKVSPDAYVWSEEGTLHKETGVFLCTADYVRYGSPSAPDGWKASPHNMQLLLERHSE
jgi:hypothetical protein